ncbi:MAG TPA: hypothetical protein VGI56_06365 [Galbitalea sp.]
MSDETNVGTPTPDGAPQSNAPQPTGGFDWLLESHQQSSVPLAPDEDVRPVTAPAAIAFPIPEPFVGSLSSSTAEPATPAPVAVLIGPEPGSAATTTAASNTPATTTAATTLALTRRVQQRRARTSPLDWAAFVLAILVAPLGLLAGIAAVLLGTRNNGFASGIAKAAIAIGAVLTLVLGVGGIGLTNLAQRQAAHDAVVASSAKWCAQLKSNPATLSSSTFGWPPQGSTIPASITAMGTYENYWVALAKIAPAGILADTQQVATSAKSIVDSVQSTQVLDDANDVSAMQSVVAASGIPAWVNEYCK